MRQAAVAGMVLAAWCANGVPTTPAIMQEMLTRVPASPSVSNLLFSVPVGLVERQIVSAYIQRQQVDRIPVGMVRERWQAHVTISNNTPSIRLTAEVALLDAGLTNTAFVRIALADAVLANVALNGIPANTIETDGWLTVACSFTGRTTIAATLIATPDRSSAEHSLRLTHDGFSIATVRIDADEALDVRIRDVPGELAGDTNTGTHGWLTAGAKRDFNLVWQPAQADVEREGTPSLITSVAWTIGERVVSANAKLACAIGNGTLDRVTIELPAGSDHLTLRGADVKDYRLEGRLLQVYFRGPISGRTMLYVSFDTPRASSTAVALPEISVANGRTVEGGWTLVARDCEGQVFEQQVAGLEPVAELELPPDVKGLSAGTLLFAYRTTTRQPSAVFDIVSTSPFPLMDTIADRAEVTAIIREDGEEFIHMVCTIRNNRSQFLRLKLPTGSDVLYIMVENKPCRVARDGDVLLIPLAKSIQTLQGLVSFPVEIVYCRQGPTMRGGNERTIRLAELPDVPAALVNVTCFCPEGMRMRSYKGVLAKVDAFTSAAQGMTYGYGYSTPGSPASQNAEAALGYNYYAAGYEAYKQNKLEEAEVFFSNAQRMTPGTSFGTKAGELLGNIKLARGEGPVGATTEERAKIANIKADVAYDNYDLEAKQQEVINQGLSLVDQQGQEELGIRLLEEAQEMGKKLTQRGGSAVQQRVLKQQFQAKLDPLVAREKENKDLRMKLRVLQDESREIAGRAGTEQPVELSSAIAAAAKETGVSAAQAGDIVLKNIARPEPAKTKTVVDRTAFYRDRLINAPAAQPTPKPEPQGGRMSLESENVQLKREVTVLSKTLDYAKKPAAKASSADRKSLTTAARNQLDDANQQLELFEKNAEKSGDGTFAYGDDDADNLDSIGTLANAAGAITIEADEKYREDLVALTNRVARVRQVLSNRRSGQQKQKQAQFDLNAVVDTRNDNTVQALNKLISANYIQQATDAPVEAQVANGMLTVNNADFTMLNDALVNFRKNDGMVTTVAGRNIDAQADEVAGTIGGFTSRTQTGRQYAVLDEAQYRTLLEVKGRNAHGIERRDVVVGSGNKVAGQQFRIAASGTDYNGIAVDGDDIRVPNDKYLALDNGGYITVIKAGRARGWQEAETAAPDLAPALPYRPEISATGVALRFEKTLLAKGESPDITLTYDLTEKR